MVHASSDPLMVILFPPYAALVSGDTSESGEGVQPMPFILPMHKILRLSKAVIII